MHAFIKFNAYLINPYKGPLSLYGILICVNFCLLLWMRHTLKNSLLLKDIFLCKDSNLFPLQLPPTEK